MLSCFSRRRFLPSALAVVVGACGHDCFANLSELRWDHLPPLPPAAGRAIQPGVASPFVGVHHDALIVAGGANFPDKLPWEGGAKAWWDDLFVLENLSSAQPRWIRGKPFKLPRPIGYGISVSTTEGIICVGGSDAEKCYADAFQLAWDPVKREIRRTELPAMPQPLAFMAGALVGNTVFVAGGQHLMKGAEPASAFWALDLGKRGTANFRWETLPTWPGPPRIVPVAAAQRTPRGEAFFLFSGRTPRGGQPTEILSDAYAFDPKARTWRTLPTIGGGAGASVMAGTAVASGQDEILIFGGDGGERFLQLEAHDREIETLRRQATSAPAGDRPPFDAKIADHLLAKKRIYETHPGFSADVLSYNTRTDSWRVVGRAPAPLPVTTLAVTHAGHVIIPTGEVRPGVRTPEVVRANLGPSR